MFFHNLFQQSHIILLTQAMFFTLEERQEEINNKITYKFAKQITSFGMLYFGFLLFLILAIIYKRILT